MEIPAGQTMVRTSSHRSRNRLARLLGERPPYYWTMAAGGCFALIPTDRLDEAERIPGITKPRQDANYGKCI